MECCDVCQLSMHSMEEAETLCDRIGIMVNESLQCIGNSKELKAKYGATYVLTITTAAVEEEAVEQLVQSLWPAANRVYRISGALMFEMPKQGLRISEVFQAMEHAKRWLNGERALVVRQRWKIPSSKLPPKVTYPPCRL